jgi:hypothetical protein
MKRNITKSVGLIFLRRGNLVRFCEDSNESSCSIKGGEFLSDYYEFSDEQRMGMNRQG